MEKCIKLSVPLTDEAENQLSAAQKINLCPKSEFTAHFWLHTHIHAHTCDTHTHTFPTGYYSRSPLACCREKIESASDCSGTDGEWYTLHTRRLAHRVCVIAACRRFLSDSHSSRLALLLALFSLRMIGWEADMWQSRCEWVFLFGCCVTAAHASCCFSWTN